MAADRIKQPRGPRLREPWCSAGLTNMYVYTNATIGWVLTNYVTPLWAEDGQPWSNAFHGGRLRVISRSFRHRNEFCYTDQNLHKYTVIWTHWPLTELLSNRSYSYNIRNPRLLVKSLSHVCHRRSGAAKFFVARDEQSEWPHLTEITKAVKNHNHLLNFLPFGSIICNVSSPKINLFSF